MEIIGSLGVWLSYFGLLLLGFVGMMLVRRKLLFEFPYFASYVAFELASSIVLTMMISPKFRMAYWYTYWAQSLIEAALSVAVIAEIFAKILGSYRGIRRVGLWLIGIAAVVITAIAIWMAVAAPPSDVPFARITVTMVVLQRSADFFRFTLLFVFFIFCRLFGLSWRHYVFGIALGLGVSTAVEVLNDSIRVQFGWQIAKIYVVVAPVAYDLGVLIWSYYLVTSESKAQVSEVHPVPVLDHWNAALEDLLAR